MNIQTQLMEDLKTAMKAKQAIKVSTIRMLRAQMNDAQIAKGEELTAEEATGILTSAAKKRKEAIAFYKKSTRDDLRAKEEAELEIISAYLPKQLGDEEIDAVVAKVIADLGATTIKEIGKVMSTVMQQLKGRADGRRVQEIARGKLT